MKNRAITLLAVAALVLVTACSRLTEDNLDKIQNGMTTTDVKAILGEPTTSDTSNALGIVTGTTYTYHTSKADVKIIFVNDKVISKEGEFQ